MQLSAFLFEAHTARDPFPPPLGLEHRQHRDQDVIVREAVWFNIRGERLGFGDLCKKDLERISADLKDEYFVIMRPGAVIMPGRPIPAPGKPYPAEDLRLEITLEHMIEQASYIVGKNEMYIIEQDDVYPEKELRRNGLVFNFITPAAFGQMLELAVRQIS